MANKSSIRFLFWRRLIQISLILLFAAGNIFQWTLLRGNYSTASIAELVPMADPFAVLQMLLAGASLSADLLIGAAIILLLYGLFFGRAFCSWICPMNMVVDLAHWLKRKFKTEAFNAAISNAVRYYILALSLILSLILGYAAYELVSPVSLLYRGLIFGIGGGWGIIGSIFLLELFSKEAVWCSKICPLGAFYSVTTRFSVLRVFHKKENCTNCNKCFVVCPEVQVLDRVGKSTGPIQFGACTACARCIEVCADDALNFKLLGKSVKS